MAFTYTETHYDAQSGKAIETQKTGGEGSTVWVGYRTVQIMSDEWEQSFSASYVDEVGRIVYRYFISSGEVDATNEAKQRAYDYLYQICLTSRTDEALSEARRIVKGSEVKVVSGRTAKGTVGKVVVDIIRPYGMGYRANMEHKLGIATSEEKVKVAAANGKVYENYKDMIWVWARNCELVTVPEIDMEAVKEAARERAEAAMKKQVG